MGYPVNVLNPVELAAGQTVILSGSLASSDQVLQSTLTTSYSTNNSTGSSVINLNGAGSLALQITSIPNGGQLQCYGSIDGNVFVGPLYAVPQYNNAQTTNGPPLTGIGSKGTIFRFDTQGFVAFQVRVNVLGSGGDSNVTFTMRANQSSSVVRVENPLLLESPRDTFNWSASNVSIAASATDVFQIYQSANPGIMRVCKIDIRGTATASSWLDYSIIRSTTLNTGGTTSPMSNSGHFDTGDSFQFANIAANYYTANPTALGATRSVVYRGKMFIPAAGSPVYCQAEVVNFGGDTHSKELALRGMTEQLSLYLGDNSTIPVGLQLTMNIRATMSS